MTQSSFEERIARLNAKSGDGGGPTGLPPRPPVPPRRSGGSGVMLIALVALVGLAGLGAAGYVVLNGKMATLADRSAEAQEIYQEARDNGASVTNAMFVAQYSRQDIEDITSDDLEVRMEAQRRLSRPSDAEMLIIDQVLARELEKSGRTDLTVEDLNPWR